MELRYGNIRRLRSAVPTQDAVQLCLETYRLLLCGWFFKQWRQRVSFVAVEALPGFSVFRVCVENLVGGDELVVDVGLSELRLDRVYLVDLLRVYHDVLVGEPHKFHVLPVFQAHRIIVLVILAVSFPSGGFLLFVHLSIPLSHRHGERGYELFVLLIVRHGNV